jgi:DNA polymerase III subunit delta'
MSWQQIRGHNEALARLMFAHARGRLAHAYLFIGPDGIGKKRFATELAKALLCERPPAALCACDRCPACQQVLAHTHPDFVITGRTEDRLEFTIDVVRALCDELGQMPLRGGRKITVLDEADYLNEEAANAFLKNLEEPPAGSLLLLLGTSTDHQLPTILSRCQILRFHPLNDDSLVSVLREQGVQDEEALTHAVRLAQGSVARALALVDTDTREFRQRLLSELCANRPDPVTLSKIWLQFQEAAGKESADQRARTSVVIGFLVDFLRTALRLALPGEPPSGSAHELGLLAKLAERLGHVRLNNLIEECLNADYLNERRVTGALIIEQLADRLCEKSMALR